MTLYTGTPPSFAANDNATVVANLNLFRDALKGLSEPWTAYTPTPSGGCTAFGSSTVAVSYHRVDKWVEGIAKITFSGATFAAATIVFTLPVATHADYASNVPIGEAFYLDSGSSATRTVGSVVTVSSTTVFFTISQTTGGTVTNAIPWTWGNTDILAYNFRYPAA